MVFTKRRRKNRTKRRLRGGVKKINLRQIRLTEPIKTAIKEKMDEVDFSGFKMMPGEQGFRLHKLENMMNHPDFQGLLDENPIEVIPVLHNGKPRGISIDGELKPLYDIVDGRHRFARAIIEEMDTIPAKIYS